MSIWGVWSCFWGVKPTKPPVVTELDSSLLIMSAKDKKSDVFSCFKNVQAEFLARSHTISLNE